MRDIQVFIGAASEAEEQVALVKDCLDKCGVATIPWRQVFRPGDYGLDALDRLARQADGAVLITSADDKTWYRGIESFSPRDNIIFELGYFLQAFGRQRIAIVRVERPDGAVPRVPTDLAGLTTINFSPGKDRLNSDRVIRWAKRFRASVSPIHSASGEISRVLRDELPVMRSDWQPSIENLVLLPMLTGLKKAVRGEIPLTTGQYYSLLHKEISEAAASSTILAVSSVSSVVLANDRDQQRYFDQNLDAALRGANIQRLFVVPDDAAADLRKVISLQDASGIDVRVTSSEHAMQFAPLEDVVMFMADTPTPFIRAYVALPTFNNPGRVRGGKLILDPAQCAEQHDAFKVAWEFGVSPREFAGAPIRRRRTAPGTSLPTKRTTASVTTCSEAAAARGVPLRNELKTLLLDTSAGVVAAHLPGDQRLSHRKVKDLLEVSESRLLDPVKLAKLGFSSGTVSALLEPVWSMPHIVDVSLLRLSFVVTNNGTLIHYFRFDPRLILEASSVVTADIKEAQGAERI